MNNSNQYICTDCSSSFDQSQIGSELFCPKCGGRLEDKEQFQNLHPILEVATRAQKETIIGDEELYLQATDEVNSENRNPALWAKAMTLSEGDTEKAKYSYIKHRVEQLIKETKETQADTSDTEIDEATLMEQYGITFSDDIYIYQGYRYNKLDDAVSYAKLLSNKKYKRAIPISKYKSIDNLNATGTKNLSNNDYYVPKEYKAEKKPRDYTLKGFFVACFASGVAYLVSIIKYHIGPSIALLLICYLSALVAYFAYLGFKKEGERWDGGEVFAGFLSSGLALLVPVVLSFLF